MLALALLPPASVTRAVIVWVPLCRPVGVSVAPMPRIPSRFDDQATAAPRLPSSGSAAPAVSASGWLEAAVAPAAGAESRGGGGACTATVIVWLAAAAR